MAKSILIKNISKKFILKDTDNGSSVELWALKDVSLEVEEGEVVGIVGRNGAGKTTLLHVIAGVLSPTNGEVDIKGRIRGLFNLGTGFQDELSGRENIFLNGMILGATKEELKKKLDSIIEFSELGDFIHMPLGSYSQGMRLRLGFSIIANLDFDILVIDEILAVGDSLFQSKCFQKLMEFKRSGMTLILTGQNLDLIERLCDKIVLLDHGSLIFYGDPAQGKSRYQALLQSEKFFVGPIPDYSGIVEQTKKWAENPEDWGKQFGTKEVVIERVKFLNRWGMDSRRFKSGGRLKIKVYFRAKSRIKDPHFGVAVFRRDGVYCHGPNTKFDGHFIGELKSGCGYFLFDYPSLLLAAGEYRVSVAIWDTKEALAYDYHNGYYPLTIIGDSYGRDCLTRIPSVIKTDNSKMPFNHQRRDHVLLDFNLLKDRWMEKSDSQTIKLDSFRILGEDGQEKQVFRTNESLILKIDFVTMGLLRKNATLWLGIFRDDRIYCQGEILPFADGHFSILFPAFAFLPGEYRISVGVWDAEQRIFLMSHHGCYPVKMIFDRCDHGTLYMKHRWSWKLPI
jgi:ABC-type polysaccharide/polyol phosphate transport system ATPase subunit